MFHISATFTASSQLGHAHVPLFADASNGRRFDRGYYADYRLSGVTLARLLDPPTTRTPDSAAIRAAESLPHIRDPHARTARIGAIYQAANGPRFSLFSNEQAGWLQTLHSRQLRAIEQLPSVRFLRF